MRVTLIIGIFFLFGCMNIEYVVGNYKESKPLVITESIGDTLDNKERHQYDLLQNYFPDFKTAVYYPLYYPLYERNLIKGYYIEVTTSDHKYLSVNRDPRAVEILRDYINNHEAIVVSRQAFEKKWNIVGYDRLGQPITREALNMANVHLYACVGGGGCMVSGIAAGFLIKEDFFSQQPLRRDASDWLRIIGGTAGCAGALAYLGNKIDVKRAWRRIQFERQPKLIE